MPADQAEGGERIIRARRGLVAFNGAELWRYRELFLFLAWRDILVRYKQTYLGVAWVVLQPVLTTLVFTVLFGKLAAFPSKGAPYEIIVFAALLPGSSLRIPSVKAATRSSPPRGSSHGFIFHA
jgi:lipopolysaccharide transport system permease protein